MRAPTVTEDGPPTREPNAVASTPRFCREGREEPDGQPLPVCCGQCHRIVEKPIDAHSRLLTSSLAGG